MTLISAEQIGLSLSWDFKCMGKTFNKPNKLISVQFNTI